MNTPLMELESIINDDAELSNAYDINEYFYNRVNLIASNTVSADPEDMLYQALRIIMIDCNRYSDDHSLLDN